jgi:FAD/FMN-containing dehydrogenase
MILFCCAADDEAKARQSAQPLLELGKAQHSDVKLVPYSEMLEEAVPPQGIKTFAQTGFVKKMDEKFIEAVAKNYGHVGTAILQIRRLGGAMARISSDETAFAWRDYEGLIWSVSPIPEQLSDEEGRTISQKSWAPIKPFTEGGYVNFVTNASHESTLLVYPPAIYARLEKIKATYDPDNIFNRNINIKPLNNTAKTTIQ